MSKTWSPLQTAIFNLIEDPNGGNAIIEAVAGSGKTTTIVEGVKRARGTTIFLAFNKRDGYSPTRTAPIYRAMLAAASKVV